MANYRNVTIEWLIAMLADGYVAICDADKQEILDVTFE
ncbi:Uncharacterised protein [Cedecea lapagei]|uniref:Uncharacterized protein n=1 Tax=Cedecea lapagei TaxID=158823 RepID=A0A447V1S5_9ENTR|nr:Uncharacterised protein [Cedecea lapagei]